MEKMNSKEFERQLSAGREVSFCRTFRILRVGNSTIRVALSSKTYMICSILDARLIELANTPDVEILEEKEASVSAPEIFFAMIKQMTEI